MIPWRFIGPFLQIDTSKVSGEWSLDAASLYRIRHRIQSMKYYSLYNLLSTTNWNVSLSPLKIQEIHTEGEIVTINTEDPSPSVSDIQDVMPIQLSLQRETTDHIRHFRLPLYIKATTILSELSLFLLMEDRGDTIPFSVRYKEYEYQLTLMTNYDIDLQYVRRLMTSNSLAKVLLSSCDGKIFGMVLYADAVAVNSGSEFMPLDLIKTYQCHMLYSYHNWTVFQYYDTKHLYEDMISINRLYSLRISVRYQREPEMYGLPLV